MSEHVLIVDDDINLLAAMRRQLRGRFIVATAPSGEEALEVIRGPLQRHPCPSLFP